ncbi:PREDICTED: uncharacterized protein LOC105449159 isoform X2 [Wasmannia auropunctata]|uniref:uncharacterized protein LOC105449159 isoform X2 n=1 Tax=Wasmannia auropunctata TaxID=64793 RepID=UPI0005F026A6|nr:PREDICTED: uncharacterized protein LOC105449159 isoform X2 [Wasmannia auropunctata]
MKKCQENAEFLREVPKNQQQQQQHQQQIATEEQQCPFIPPTTPVWGDRNVSEQPMEETNNNIGFSFANLLANTSDARLAMCNLSSSRNSSPSSTLSLTENIQSFSEAAPLRKCRVCFYVAMDRTEYVDHVISHCTFAKETYAFESDTFLNGYFDDEETEEVNNDSQSKGKKRNKVSKPKQCCKCKYLAKTKLALWMHLRQHFLQGDCTGFVCILCPFATMLKHHMTFHWFSAHDDFKGYTCTECSYTCVSKSMLTSHKKTHSEVYQFNCASCPYRTKFCNAMKKHLKDSLHIPGPVLDADGTPNPFATIDVYGNKRGPRRKPLVEERKEPTEIIRDSCMPSTSGLTSPVLPMPTTSTPVLPLPIPSAAILDSSDSNAELIVPSLPIQRSPVRISPIQRSPVRISPTQRSPAQLPAPVPPSHSNSLVTAILATCNRTNSENGVNPSSNEQSSLLNSSAFIMLCHFLFRTIASRPDVDVRQRSYLLENAQRILGDPENAQRIFDDPEHVEHAAGTTANGDLSDNANSTDQPSTSTTLVSAPRVAAEEDRPAENLDESTEALNVPMENLHAPTGNLDEPLDLSMSAMARRPQFQISIPSSSSRRKRKRKATRLEYPTTNENTENSATRQVHATSSLLALLTIQNAV